MSNYTPPTQEKLEAIFDIMAFSGPLLGEYASILEDYINYLEEKLEEKNG